jgi:hypothetical protein
LILFKIQIYYSLAFAANYTFLAQLFCKICCTIFTAMAWKCIHMQVWHNQQKPMGVHEQFGGQELVYAEDQYAGEAELEEEEGEVQDRCPPWEVPNKNSNVVILDSDQDIKEVSQKETGLDDTVDFSKEEGEEVQTDAEVVEISRQCRRVLELQKTTTFRFFP